MGDGLLIVLAIIVLVIIVFHRKKRNLIDKIERYQRWYPQWFKKHIGDCGDIEKLSFSELEEYNRVIEVHNSTIEAENKRLKDEEFRQFIESQKDYQDKLKKEKIREEYLSFQKWYRRQMAYTNQSRYYRGCWRDMTKIEIDNIDEEGNKKTYPLVVCHLALNIVCLEQYTEVGRIMFDENHVPKNNRILPTEYPIFKQYLIKTSGKCVSATYKDDIDEYISKKDFDRILNFIAHLAVKNTLLVLFADSIEEQNRDYRTRVYPYMKEELGIMGIPYLSAEDFNQLPSGEYSVVVIELITTKESLYKLCHSLFSKYPQSQYVVTYFSLFADYPLSVINDISDTQIKKDREALETLLKEGTLLSPHLGWKKTGIIRLFLTEQVGRHCLILTSAGGGVHEWKCALSDLKLDEHSYIVASYSNYEDYDDTNYDLLVFDITDTLELGKRAEICKRIEAEYVLTLGSVSDEDEELMKKAQMPNRLKACVFSWDYVPQSDLHHSFFIKYFPISLQDFEATNDEWQDRWFIWNFKNNPDKQKDDSPYYHKQALDNAIDMIEERLKETFGELLPELTLVCIPASSPSKNEARYKEFSERLCDNTGMSNAYTHISVTEDAVGRHEGGMGGNVDSIDFDRDYFDGRYILLFDDVLTTGGSMRKYAERFASHGAEVIACMTLGKTFHHREEEPEEIEFD